MGVTRGTIFQLDDSCLLTSDLAAAAPAVEHVSLDPTSLVEESLRALELEQEEAASPDPTSAGDRPDGGSTCLTCAIGTTAPGFASTEEQRAHFKTDWHRYNVKRRVAGLAPATEEQFAALLENEDDQDAVGSLSGSESDEDSDEEPEPPASVAGPQFAFPGPEGATLAVWRCLVAPERERGVTPPSQAECVRALRQLRNHGGRWCIILYRGGHFAAALYQVTPPKPGAKTPAAPGSLLKLLEHKSFHRYVVRCLHVLAANMKAKNAMLLCLACATALLGSSGCCAFVTAAAGPKLVASSRLKTPLASSPARPVPAFDGTTKWRCSAMSQTL